MFLGKTNSSLCPVSAILNYLAVWPSLAGPLFIFKDGTPLTRDVFCKKKLMITLKAAHAVDPDGYSGHSFRIWVATTAVL